MCFSICLSVFLSICPSLDCLSFCFCLPLGLSIHVSISLSSLCHILSKYTSYCSGKTWRCPKRSRSASPPHCWNLTTSTVKQRLPSKCDISVQADGLVLCLRFFPFHLSEILRMPGESRARSYDVLHSSCKIILDNLKIWCSKMQPSSESGARTS